MQLYFEYFAIFIITVVFIKFIQRYASLLKLIDKPNKRSQHLKDMPRGAGIAFILAISITLFSFHFEIVLDFIATFIAILIVFLIGIWDDCHNSSPKIKFLIIAIAAAVAMVDNFIILDIGTIFGFKIVLDWYIGVPLTLFSVVGFTNALNLIDGLDGLAGGISIVILGAFFVIGYNNNNIFLIGLSSSLIIGLLAFLLFNWHPSSIFMGDSGSLTLGFIISILAIESLKYIPAISILFITAIPLFDTIIVMIRRKREVRSPFKADKTHIHHIVQRFFNNRTKKSVIFLIFLQFTYILIGLSFEKGDDEAIAFMLFFMNIIILYLVFTGMLRNQQRRGEFKL